jgi:hypothetical protein
MAYGKMKAVKSHKVGGSKGGGFKLNGDSKFHTQGGVKANSGKKAMKRAGKQAA